MAGRMVHIALLGVCGQRAAAAADGDERAITACVFVRGETVEPLCRRCAPRFLAAVDVAGGFGCLAGESRAGEKRSVGADGVGVAPMNLTGTHVHAVRRRE